MDLITVVKGFTLWLAQAQPLIINPLLLLILMICKYMYSYLQSGIFLKHLHPCDIRIDILTIFNFAFLSPTFPCLRCCGGALRGQVSVLLLRRLERWLLPEEEADVEAEGGQEAHVQQDDHQQVPPTRPPGTNREGRIDYDFESNLLSLPHSNC